MHYPHLSQKSRILLGAVAVIAMAVPFGCRHPGPPHPLEGVTRFTCCNLRYEKDRVMEYGTLRGTILPAGTPVRLDEISKNNVVFKPEDAPILRLTFKGKEGYLSFDEYLERVFVTDDPRPRIQKFKRKTVSAIHQAEVLEGMTKEQVLMALGYPPARLTPSLNSPNWRYLDGGKRTVEIFFEDGVVGRIVAGK